MHTGTYFWFFENSVFPLFYGLFLMQGCLTHSFLMGPNRPIAAPNTVLHFCSKRNIELNDRPASSEISLLHQQSSGPVEAIPLEELWWNQRLEQIENLTQLHPAIKNPMRFLAFVALKSLQTPRRLIHYIVEEASGVLVWSGKLHKQHRDQNGVWRRASSKSFWRRAPPKISTTSFSITSKTPERQGYNPLISRLW